MEGCQRAAGTLATERWLACACILVLTCAPSPAMGQAKDPSPDDEEVARAVLAETVHVLYHELGHGLVHLLELPVLGSEEDAVDGFATVRMIANRSGRYGEGLLAEEARVWVLAYEKGLEAYGSTQSFHGVAGHGLDLQRHFAIVCLLVGSDPRGRRQYAIDAGLPEERIEECRGDHERMRDGWESLLATHAPNASRPVSRVRPETRDGNVTVVYKEPKKKGHRWIRRLVEDSGLVETVVDDVMFLVSLPKDVKVVFKSCGEANAFFDFQGNPTVVMCYELLAQAGANVKKDIAKRSEAAVDPPRIFPNVTLDEERTAIFVLGNTLFAVYHELATALVHELDLPVVTDVTYAADSFAAISMIPDDPDDFHDRLVVAAANGWYLAGAGLEDSELAFWSGGGVAKQRHFAVLCLFVGSDPDGQFDFGRGHKLPASAFDKCSESMYQPNVDGWEELLRPHAPSARANTTGEIGLVYGDVGVKAHAALRDVVKDSGVVEEAIDKVMGMVGLPRNLQVVFMDCRDDGTGGDMTFFDADGGKAVICYSFLARLEARGKDAVARQTI